MKSCKHATFFRGMYKPRCGDGEGCNDCKTKYRDVQRFLKENGHYPRVTVEEMRK